MTHYDPDWLDGMYNNRARVPEFAEHFTRWQQDSATARARCPCVLDAPYGSDPGETLDIFSAAGGVAGAGRAGAPVLVFLHGGYWRSLDKADHSFIAPAFTAQGACVVVPNYALCPGTVDAPVTVPHITLQMVKTLAWVWRHIAAHGGDPQRITVVGHSAGGHLAAMLLTCRWQVVAPDLPSRLVKNALSISGLHELESIMHAPSLQSSLQLTAAQVRQASPAWLPRPDVSAGRCVLHAVAGGLESAEFLRHNQLIRDAWGEQVVPVCETLPGLNHFSILEALVAPDHALHRLACDLLLK